jgi:hypothetical protein
MLARVRLPLQHLTLFLFRCACIHTSLRPLPHTHTNTHLPFSPRRDHARLVSDHQCRRKGWRTSQVMMMIESRQTMQIHWEVWVLAFRYIFPFQDAIGIQDVAGCWCPAMRVILSHASRPFSDRCYHNHVTTQGGGEEEMLQSGQEPPPPRRLDEVVILPSVVSCSGFCFWWWWWGVGCVCVCVGGGGICLS